MPTARQNMAVASSGTKLFVVGGWGLHTEYLDSLEILDTTTVVWSSASSMPTSRNAVAAAVVGSMLFALGGIRNDNPLDMIEAYDIEGDSWSQATPMETRRAAFAAVAVP